VAFPVRVLSAGAMRRIVGELAETFHRETGHPVALTTGTVGALTARATPARPPTCSC
jgi:ABC-type molybdate transport system substrate-binding protein